jgi:hypothetical protein
MQIAMLDFIASKSSLGRLLLSATRQTPISSNAQIPSNAVPLPIAGMCLKLIDVQKSRSVFLFILRKEERQWVGNQTILSPTSQQMTL